MSIQNQRSTAAGARSRRRSSLALAAVGAAAVAVSFFGAGCSIEPASPSNPTFEADILPIMRARCIRCHGVPVLAEDGGATPYVYVQGDAGLVLFGNTSFEMLEDSPECAGDGGNSNPACVRGVRSAAPQIVKAIQPSALAGVRMPPPPAPLLTKAQIDTIVHWAANPQ
jgi:hypothetical protein